LSGQVQKFSLPLLSEKGASCLTLDQYRATVAQAYKVYGFRLRGTDHEVSIPPEEISDPILEPTADLIIGQCRLTAVSRALRTMSEQKLIHSSSLFLRLSSICEEDENRDNRCQYQNSAESDLVDRYTDKTPEDEETKR
jgi:hypothetical protein